MCFIPEGPVFPMCKGYIIEKGFKIVNHIKARPYVHIYIMCGDPNVPL